MAYQAHIVIPTDPDGAEAVIDKIKAGAAKEFGGFSLYNGTGGWVGSDGLIEENHVRIVINADTKNKGVVNGIIEAEARYIKHELEQDSVLYEIHEIDMELV